MPRSPMRGARYPACYRVVGVRGGKLRGHYARKWKGKRRLLCPMSDKEVAA